MFSFFDFGLLHGVNGPQGKQLLREIKHYILPLQQDDKSDYTDEYIKAMQDQVASLKSEVMFLRGELNKKKHLLNN